MKNLFKSPILIAFIATSMFFTGCSDDTVAEDPEDPTEMSGEEEEEEEEEIVYDLIVNSSNEFSGDRTLEIEAEPGSTITVNLNFTSADGDDDKKMRRVYGTDYTYGDLAVGQYEFGADTDTKADGSLDIESADGFEFIETLEFTAPALDETDQYNFWTTNARGDFRDVSNSNAISGDAYGSITIKGAAVEALADIESAESVLNEFTATILAAPLADGTSETFISLYDGQTHKISDGAELLALWDFGYFYGTTSGASFYSVEEYPKVFTINGEFGFHVYEFVSAEQSELNNFYFATSSMDYDAVTTSSDLDAISISSLTAGESISGLEVGDVVAFQDQYGNNGLIRVTNLVDGNGTAGKITFDIKVQVNAVPVIL